MNERELFAAALEKSTAEEQRLFLDAACGADTALRDSVQALLRERSELGSFLEQPVLAGEVTRVFSETSNSDTAAESGPPTEPEFGAVRLDFLEPSDEPNSLGRLGQYEILQVIGHGGMGIVLKARDTSLQRVVAVKVLAPELASNPTARKRFLREAQAAAAVGHDHVVTTYAVNDGRDACANRLQLPYLAMEFIDGQSLQQKLRRTGPLELKEILRIGRQTASALAAAHAQGLIHRDVKPGNILLQNGIERVQITDFGLARAADDVAITRTGEVAGTPDYMSPEQAQGHLVDTRSDLFSLGSVLYAMCTGRAPFRAETTMGTLRRVCDESPRPIREVNPEIPDWLVAIIDRLLAKDPDDRFQTAKEVEGVLRKHLAHLQNPESTPFPGLIAPAGCTASGRGHGRQRWLVAGLLILGVCLGVSEATGTTHLAATVVRIVTGEGALVIEVDDPTVQVSLDGEELSISGGGLQEIKLRPGQYQFTAMKDGEPVRQELVTISRGDRQVVRVTREPAAAIPPASSPIERGAFVVLNGNGNEVRKFDTLADAVVSSTSGDTIEIRGNGPFVTGRIDFQHPLTVRAGAGFRPVIVGDPQTKPPRGEGLLFVEAPLVLEGLDLQAREFTFFQSVAPVAVANGRFLNTSSCLLIQVQRNSTFKQCQISSLHGNAVDVWPSDELEIVLQDCLIAGTIRVEDRTNSWHESLTLRHCTVVSPGECLLATETRSTAQSELTGQPTRIFASGNIFDPAHVFGFFLDETDPPNITAAGELESLLSAHFEWRDERNLYREHTSYLEVAVPGRPLGVTRPTLQDWNEYWGQADTGSQAGLIRFQGGDLHAKALTAPDQLTPAEFRLRPDSAGYQAGPDGKDLGADVDLVGPGEAYERWKKTPDYAKWRQDIARLMTGDSPDAAAQPPASGAADANEPQNKRDGT